MPCTRQKNEDDLLHKTKQRRTHTQAQTCQPSIKHQCLSLSCLKMLEDAAKRWKMLEDAGRPFGP